MAYMASMTLKSMRDLVRVVLHEYDSTQGTFWLDASLNLYINSAYKYYMLLLERYNPGIFAEIFTALPVVANVTTSVALPPEFLVPWALWWRPTGDTDLSLLWKAPRFVGMESATGAYPTFEDDNVVMKPSVRIIGSTVLLIPTPTISGDIIPEGTVFPIDLAQDTDTVDPRIHPIIHPLIAKRAAFLALSEDSDSPQEYAGLTLTLTDMEKNLISILAGATYNPLEEPLGKTTAPTVEPKMM